MHNININQIITLDMRQKNKDNYNVNHYILFLWNNAPLLKNQNYLIFSNKLLYIYSATGKLKKIYRVIRIS